MAVESTPRSAGARTDRLPGPSCARLVPAARSPASLWEPGFGHGRSIHTTETGKRPDRAPSLPSPALHAGPPSSRMPPLTQPCQTPVTPPPPRRLPLSREGGANAGRGRSTRSQCGLGSFEYGAVARTGNFVTGGCGCEPRLRSVTETPSRHPLPVPACYALHLWSLWSRAVGTRSEGRVPKPAARPLRPHGNLCLSHAISCHPGVGPEAPTTPVPGPLLA